VEGRQRWQREREGEANKKRRGSQQEGLDGMVHGQTGRSDDLLKKGGGRAMRNCPKWEGQEGTKMGQGAGGQRPREHIHPMTGMVHAPDIFWRQRLDIPVGIRRSKAIPTSRARFVDKIGSDHVNQLGSEGGNHRCPDGLIGPKKQIQANKTRQSVGKLL